MCTCMYASRLFHLSLRFVFQCFPPSSPRASLPPSSPPPHSDFVSFCHRAHPSPSNLNETERPSQHASSASLFHRAPAPPLPPSHQKLMSLKPASGTSSSPSRPGCGRFVIQHESTGKKAVSTKKSRLLHSLVRRRSVHIRQGLASCWLP